MAAAKHIIALGGGGFSMEPDNPALDQYILRQARTKTPNVCFVPTASGDSDDYIQRFYASFKQHTCTPTHLSFFRDPPSDLHAFIMRQDVIYVGGGNTRNMLLIWRDRGMDAVLQQALDAGIVLTGVSAGSICWFKQGVTDSNKPKDSDELSAMSCLGLLPHSNCPHYDGEANRRPEYHRLLKRGEIGEGWAADDGVGLHYIDGELHKVVSSRPYAAAYWVHRDGGSVQEEARRPSYLGS